MRFILLAFLVCSSLLIYGEGAADSTEGSGSYEFLDPSEDDLDQLILGGYLSGDGFSGDGAIGRKKRFIFSSKEAPDKDKKTQGHGKFDAEKKQLDKEEYDIPATNAPYQVPEPTIENYHILSKVTARYVSTSVLATVVNTANISQEVLFSFLINEEAFISSYVMTIDGVAYEAEVREKEVAQKAYNQARNDGRDASQVKQKDGSRFLVDLNLAPQSNVIFNLTYQELLRRDEGQFTHRINVAPGQVVPDLRVDVNILEPQGITFIDTRWISEDDAVVPFVSFYPPTSQASIFLRPSKSLQSNISADFGLVGVLEVIYDVHHDLSGGDIQIANGYFVHYISPEGMLPAPKKVIYTIDTSGSMGGIKIEQTKEVMIEILRQLRDVDFFNVLTFTSFVSYWRPYLVQATPENIQAAQSFVLNLLAGGGTFIYDALLASFRQFNDTEEDFSAIFLLTDGQDPSNSERFSEINSEQKVALYTIGFGFDVNPELLEQLAVENGGVFCQIMIGSDAGQQMRSFFEEFQTPLLFNISVRYEDDAVNTTSMTDKKFVSYFEGKELMVAGKLSEDYTGSELKAVITAKGHQGQMELEATKEIRQVDPIMIRDFARRSWAYMNIKSLLALMKVARSLEEKESLKQRALILSLRYSFVTPLTSLLVIKPEERNNVSSPEENTELDPIPNPPKPQPKVPVPRPYVPPQRGGGGGGGGGSGGGGGAYGDPHIVIQDFQSDLKVCFDIHGPNGTVVNLLDEPNLGIRVNGEMMEGRNKKTHLDPAKTKPTFFRRFAIHVADDWIVLSCDGITIDGQIPLAWTSIVDVRVGSCTITLRNGETATIECSHGVEMKVSRQVMPDKTAHLDFQLGPGGSFSSSVNGIVGQFQRRQMTLIEPPKHSPRKYGMQKAKLVLDGEVEVAVHKVFRQQIGTCWSIYVSQGLTILEMSYLKYVLMGIFDEPDYDLA